jgi:hypothetical protein
VMTASGMVREFLRWVNAAARSAPTRLIHQLDSLINYVRSAPTRRIGPVGDDCISEVFGRVVSVWWQVFNAHIARWGVWTRQIGPLGAHSRSLHQ